MDTIKTPVEQMRHSLPPPKIRSPRRKPSPSAEDDVFGFGPDDSDFDAETPYDIPENDSPARWR